MGVKRLGWMRKNKGLIRAAVFAGLIILLIPFARNLTVENIVEFASPSIPLAILVFVAIYASKALTTFPPLTVLYIATGIIFPTGLGIAINYICLAIMVSIGYMAGRIMSREKVRGLISKHKKFAVFFDEESGGNPVTLCFISRFMPAPANDIFSLFFGAIGISYKKFLLASLLGFSPYMLLVVFTAGSVSNPFSAGFIIPLVFCVVVSIGSTMLYKRRLGK